MKLFVLNADHKGGRLIFRTAGFGAVAQARREKPSAQDRGLCVFCISHRCKPRTKSRRADSNRFPSPPTSDNSSVAGVVRLADPAILRGFLFLGFPPAVWCCGRAGVRISSL